MLYRLNSLCSNRISEVGAWVRICRHSSEPIDPPAPVTITTLLPMQRWKSSGRGATASRPSRSAISTSWISSTLTRPLARSMKPGTLRTCSGKGSSAVSISRRRPRVAEGIASNTSLALVSSIIC
ncbi:hypothetical protein D3C85_1132960 [compost metagenome]